MKNEVLTSRIIIGVLCFGIILLIAYIIVVEKQNKSNKEHFNVVIDGQKKELDEAKEELNTIKEREEKNCGDISLDSAAPSYSVEETERFLNDLNVQGLTKKLGMADLKHLIDLHYATQWQSARPECKSEIDAMVEDRWMHARQREQTDNIVSTQDEILDQQKKMLNYNQCLTTNNHSFCQYLLY